MTKQIIQKAGIALVVIAFICLVTFCIFWIFSPLEKSPSKPSPPQMSDRFIVKEHRFQNMVGYIRQIYVVKDKETGQEYLMSEYPITSIIPNTAQKETIGNKK